jgi:7,8-dihydropterin-6-yl-methyl-4-(beta-D-ribofuranosyl)aminobenzene 5'-phosphate synthase
MMHLTRREILQFGGCISVGIAMAPSGLLFLNSSSGSSSGSMEMEINPFEDHQTHARLEALKLTVIYDNWSYAPGIATDWGFACLVEGLQQTLLFDSGRLDATFISNLERLGIDRHRIDAALLSHEHHDHIGGLPRLLHTRPAMKVYLPVSFSSGYKKLVSKKGGQVVEVDQPARICAHAASTGQMRSVVKNEHSLVVRTDKGAVVLTGCAHPGILGIVQRARTMAQQDILLVMGGFHLLHDSDKSIHQVIDGFDQAGIRFVAPSHCSGEQALQLFAEAYGSRFIRSGAGRVIVADDLDETRIA